MNKKAIAKGLRDRNDADYLHKLSEEELAYYIEFIDGLYKGNFSDNKIQYSQDEKRDIWNEINAGRFDLFKRSNAATIECLDTEQGYDLGSLVDAAKRRKKADLSFPVKDGSNEL